MHLPALFLLFAVTAVGTVHGSEGDTAGIHADERIPHFARKYDLDCSACHVSPPKLNEFGENFVRGNYRLPDREARRTVPLAVWVSTRADFLRSTPDLGREVTAYVNRIEVVSGGAVVAPWLSYFVEWRPLSFDVRGDGSLRDRSGRFEDLFLTAQADRLEVSLGQFRQIAQVDVSRRIGVNEPAFYSTSLPGVGGDDRMRGLRGFSLSGRAPSVRLGWIEPIGTEWDWTNYLSVSVPGEFSLPLTREARREASNEIELRARGIFAESFVRRGLHSWGMHAFYDSSDRYLFGGVGTGRHGALLWTAALGAHGIDGTLRGRSLLEAEYIRNRFLAIGGRVEDQAGGSSSFAPYLNAHFPGTRHTFRLTLEHRFQEGRNGTFLELGTVF